MSYLQFTVPSEPISLDYVPEVRLRYLKFAFCQPFFLDLGTRYQQVHCTVAQLLASSLALTREDLLNIIGGHHLTKPCDLRKKFDIARWLLQHSCNSLCQSTVYVFDIQRHERDIGTSVLLPTKPGTVPVRARPLTAISDVQLPPTLKDKANELQASAFKLASNDFLSKIAQEWNSFFSDENFDTSPCLVCGERLLRKDARIVAKGEFTSDQKFLLQDQSLPTNLLPRHYDFKAWESAIIDPGAIYLENGVEKCRLCTSCYNFLFKSPPQMPPLALANGNYDAYACVPAGVQEAFEAATEIEKLIIGAARASRIHYKLSRKPGSSQFGKPDQVSASYSRGNTIILPQNTVNFQNVIPGNVESFQDAVCILFLGSEPPTEEWINRQQPLIVTKSRVKLLIEWLVNYSGNSVYTKLEVSDSNLRNILREPRGVPSFLLPSFVSNRAELVGQNYASLESLGPRVAGDSTYDPTVSQTTGYIEPTLNRNSMESKIQALRHFRSGKPVFMIPRGQVPIDDLHDPSWLTAVWPHLDPFNLLGFHRKRKVEVTLAAQVAHLLRMHHGRFATDPAFPYIMFNLIQRRENMKRAYYAIPDRSINTFEQDVRSLSPDMLNNLVAKLKKDSAYKPTDPEESVAFNLVRNMRIYNSHANGSDGKRIKFRREIQGMICRHGMYSMFITINPADKNNPLMLKLGGKDVSLADDINTHLFSAWDQEVFAAKRPDISAEFFDTMVQSFLHIVLKVDGTQQGLFGRVKAYHGNCENQGRSTYHMHLVLWLHGHGNPLEMERTIQQDPAFRAKVVAWLEQHIHSHMSSQTQPATVQFDAYSRPERAPGQQNPCTRGQITAPVGSSEFNARVDDLVIENQYHTHGPVCIKGRKAAAASDETCRFRINGSTQAETTTEEALILRRFHGRLTEFNPLMMSLLRCNMHLAYIGYGEFAYSWMMYTTNYTTKGNMPMHEGLAGLCAALSKHKNGENQSARNLLLRTLNQMSARTEICGPQVHRYLTGLEDRYTGDQFATLPWTLFDANIKRLEDLAEQESRSDSGYNEMQIDADLIEQQREDQTQNAGGASMPAWMYSLGQEEPAAGPNDLEHTEVILDDTGIGSDEHEDQDETTVAIERSMDGSFFVKSDFEHYTKRPRSHTFENMCLYDFISRVRIKKDTSCRDTPKDKHLDPGHTLFKSHVAILYRRPRTVTFSGKAIPLAFPHQPKYEDCCRAFLILFKPWRCLQDLKGVRDSWIKSHETYTYPTELKERQACLMALHTGKLAVEKHQALLRSQQQPQGVGMPHLIGLDIADKEHEWLIQGYKHNLLTLDELMNDELGGLESETFDDGLAQQSLQPYRREEIAAAERLAQYLQTAGSVEEDPPADGVVRLIDGESLKGLQDQFRNLYTRLNREEAENTVNTDADTDMLSVPTSVDVKKAFLSKNRQTEASLNYASLVATVKDHYEAVAQQHGLNPAQAASLRLLARQICIGAYGKPLLHYVGGVGGTGKSLVIHAMKELLARCDMSDAYHCAAPTGCAATLIGGNTLHFLCKISTAQKKEIAQVEPRDVRRWENVHFLIIDEISMVGAGTLHHVDHFFRVLRPHLRDVPFAGMNIICFGDFGQLAPVKQIPIYSKTFENVSASAMGQQKPNAWNAQGVLAWRQFEDVILLTENWRQKKDPAYASMLMRIRKGHNCRERRAGCDGECNRKDFAMLNSVLLESSSFYNAADFVDAPIIVGTKSLRDQINTLKARLHAQRMGVTDYVYFADDTYTGGKQQMDARVRIMLSRLAANKVDDMLGELPLFPGMQVMLVENQCTPIGLVNGAVGIVHSIDFTLDVLNRKVAKCAYVAFRNVEAPSIPNVPPGTFPITPKSKAFRYHKDQHSDVIPFSRKQLPLVPAYAMTDYKSQGQTIKKAIVDLATSQSLSGVYVMLSRVSSIRDIIVLRPFGMDRIMHSCNSKGEVYVDDKGHGLLDELDRLDKVCHTNLNWNLEDTL